MCFIYSGQLAANICLEWKRMKRRRHLEDSYPDAGSSTSGDVNEFDSQVSDMIHQSSFPSSHQAHFHGCGSPSTSGGSAMGLTHGSREQPMFTLKQVIIICERMLKEQEARIQEDYDKVLSCKLAGKIDILLHCTQLCLIPCRQV